MSSVLADVGGLSRHEHAGATSTRPAGSDPAELPITGAGRAFCAGADVKSPRELTPAGHRDLSVRLREKRRPDFRDR